MGKNASSENVVEINTDVVSDIVEKVTFPVQMEDTSEAQNTCSGSIQPEEISNGSTDNVEEHVIETVTDVTETTETVTDATEGMESGTKDKSSSLLTKAKTLTKQTGKTFVKRTASARQIAVGVAGKAKESIGGMFYGVQ